MATRHSKGQGLLYQGNTVLLLMHQLLISRELPPIRL